MAKLNGKNVLLYIYAEHGSIATLGAITPGSLYANGTYLNVALTGGAGTRARANITVSDGAVTAVTLVSGGLDYVVGNSLTAAATSIGGTGSGFAIPVATLLTGYKAAVCATSSSLGRTADRIDTSSKCDDGYSSSLNGRKSANISFGGYAETLPSAGSISYQAIEDLYETDKEIDFKIGNASKISGFIDKYGTGVISSLNLNFSDGEAVQFDMEIAVNGAVVTTDPNP